MCPRPSVCYFLPHTLPLQVGLSFLGGLKGAVQEVVGLVCVHVPLPNVYAHVPCLVATWVGPEQKSTTSLSVFTLKSEVCKCV